MIPAASATLRRQLCGNLWPWQSWGSKQPQKNVFFCVESWLYSLLMFVDSYCFLQLLNVDTLWSIRSVGLLWILGLNEAHPKCFPPSKPPLFGKHPKQCRCLSSSCIATSSGCRKNWWLGTVKLMISRHVLSMDIDGNWQKKSPARWVTPQPIFVTCSIELCWVSRLPASSH